MMAIFDRDLWFVPLSVSRVKIFEGGGLFRGVARVRIFGVLVAEIQESKPW